MPHEMQRHAALKSAIESIALVARLEGIPLAPDWYRQLALPDHIEPSAKLVLAARALGLKAAQVSSSWQQLQQAAFPLIAQHRYGHYFVIAGMRDERLLVHDPLEKRPVLLSRELLQSSWTGEVVMLARQPFKAQGSFRKFGISWFLPVFWRYRRLFAEVLLAAFFLQLFALLTPLFFQVVIDKVLVHKGLTTLDVLAIGLLGLSLFEILLGGLRNYLFSHTSSRIDVILGSRLYRHLLALPLAYFSHRRVGDSVARVRELDTIRQFIGGSAMTLVIDLLFTLVFFLVLYHYSPLLTAVVAASIPLYLLMSWLITPLLRRRLDEKFALGAENQAFLVESVTGVETLKSLALESEMQKRWEMRLAAYLRASFDAGFVANLAEQFSALVNKVSVVLILWIGATLVIQGELSVGQLIAFNMIAARISAPLLRLVQLWQDFQQAAIAVERLGDILDTPREDTQLVDASSVKRLGGEVHFEAVSFRYDPVAPRVLENINLQVDAGEVIGVVGRSGSGKSTLGRLLQRLYVPESGRVFIDGVDIARLSPGWLRTQIGVVMQDNFLFNLTIRENIALAAPGASMQQISEAARLAGAHDFIRKLPHGYETRVGEQGNQLSGGQRQRIAIARALVSNPAILVFDEATSALDYESEQAIQQNMRDICQGRTVFIIAHRLSSVRDCDRIIYIDNGNISEQGKHESLIRAGGGYSRLYALQSAGARV